MNNVNLDFLGRGWAFPFDFDAASGTVLFSAGVENIRQNILIIIGTRIGERQMLPTFGCRIHELLFAPNNSDTSRLASEYVASAVSMWEPRIEVLEVRAVISNAGSINVNMSYRINATSSIEYLEHLVG
ncbi:MAG: GPW/gp25 family protein [Myxococcota bacterium]|nr:GPW/gp25 family protein [Myxococcota bacterium]